MKTTQLVHDATIWATKYYEGLFQTPYPFKKLDLIVCPNVRYSGMESAACIVFSEQFLATKSITVLQQSNFADEFAILFHEISH
jgi:aminopeptidase N